MKERRLNSAQNFFLFLFLPDVSVLEFHVLTRNGKCTISCIEPLLREMRCKSFLTWKYEDSHLAAITKYQASALVALDFEI